MLAVTRYRIAADEESSFAGRAHDALAALAARPGYLRGHVGRSTDEPGLWALVSEWVGVGAYRRALSSYDVKIRAVPLLSLAVDEPSAYEIVSSVVPDGTDGSGERLA